MIRMYEDFNYRYNRNTTYGDQGMVEEFNKPYVPIQHPIKEEKMSKQHHYLKTESVYYQAFERGDKSFEVRKNDRNFKVSDMVYLQETVNGIRTGRELEGKEITYILYGGVYGIDPDYCVMQL